MIQCGNIYVIHAVTVSYKRRLKYSLKLKRLDVNTLFCDYISNIRILKYSYKFKSQHNLTKNFGILSL